MAFNAFGNINTNQFAIDVLAVEEEGNGLPEWHLKATVPLPPKGQETPRIVNGIPRRVQAQRKEVQVFRDTFITNCLGLESATNVFYPAGMALDFLVVGFKRRPNAHFRKRNGVVVRSVPMLTTKESNNVEYIGVPDNDNVLKFVKDALEGLIFHNDSQTVRDQCMMQWDTLGSCDGWVGIYTKPFSPTDHDQFKHLFDEF